MKIIYSNIENNTGVGYNTIIKELGDHTVPAEWAQYVKHNTEADTAPGAPIQWDDPSDPESALPGYGFVADNSGEPEETFYYHSDHLGSTSYITDKDGNITQYDAYLPYGELLVDEHSSSEDLPYKFNGKELDEETGLYYYGARYMQPVASIWYGVDPLAEKYPNVSAYTYCLGNPIKLVDTDGEKVIPIRITGKRGNANNSYYHSNKTFYNAMVAFGKTDFGHQLLADFTPKGSTIFGVKGNGKYANFNIIILEADYDSPQDMAAAMPGINGATRMLEEKGTPSFELTFNVQNPEGDLLEIILHEFIIHLSDYAEVLEAYKKGNYSDAEKVHNKTSEYQEHKDLTRKTPILKGTKIYRKTIQELIDKYPEFKKAFESAQKDYNGKY